MADEEKSPDQAGFIDGIVSEIIYSPLNLILLAFITFLLYKIFRSSKPQTPAAPSEPELPKIRKDFTVAELKAFDGKQPDGRVLVAVNGTVYDVTRGKRFYGPGELPCCTRAAPLSCPFLPRKLTENVPIELLFTHCNSNFSPRFTLYLGILLSSS